jgi:hypothetical protein
VDELERAARRLEAERVAPPVRPPWERRTPATAEELAAFDAEWTAHDDSRIRR